MRLFQGFALAFSMLSILPFFKVHDFFKGINAYSAMFYPLVGFLLGLMLWTLHTLLTPYFPPLHLGVIIFVVWMIITGALHLDGFSDSVDGLFVSKERALEVMKDAHVGGMGMSFTVVFLLFKLSSLLYADAYYLLPVILMFSRLNATLSIYFFDYISKGVSSLIKEELQLRHIVFASLYSLIIAYFFSATSLILISLFIMLLTARFFTKRLGGLNGDVYGFMIEVSELAMLNLLIVEKFS